MPRVAIPLLLFSAFFVICAAAGAGGPEKETPQSVQRNIDALERQQAQLIQDLKKQINSLKDGPRREELRRHLADIERHIPPRKLYLSPFSKMTAEMAAYHARLLRRIEDCGTRNFPKREGKSVYGKGFAAITLDRSGKAVNTEILESSGEKLLDAHMAKIVRASSPFGVLPSRALLDEGAKPFDLVVVVSGFKFENDAAPVPPLDEKERCKWQ